MKKQYGLCVLGIVLFLLSGIDVKALGSKSTHPKKIEQKMSVAGNVYSEILAQEKAWAAALVAGEDPSVADLDTVEALMHRDFRLKRISGDMVPIDKTMYLSMKGMSGYSAEVTSFKIIEQMGAIVVARVTWSMDWARNGVKLPSHWDLIDTWIKDENGTWQILSRLSQPMDKPYRAAKKLGDFSNETR